MSSEPAVNVISTASEFVTAAARWSPDDPFPVLGGPEMDRYAALFAPRGLPAVSVYLSAGQVIWTGTNVAGACARLLGAVTGRSVRGVPPTRLGETLAGLPAGTPVAVVASLDAVRDAGDWPVPEGVRGGLLTARTDTALSALVYRTVTLGARLAAAPGRGLLTVSHPFVPGALDADVVTEGDLRDKLEGSTIAVLTGQGRECSISMLDAVLCGRSLPMGVPLPVAKIGTHDAARRHTPCVDGGPCFRTDLQATARYSVRDINSVVVIAHGCSAVTVGASAYPAELSLSLSLLESTAVAVVGCHGVHLSDPYVVADVSEAASATATLADLADSLSAPGGRRSELNRWVLLGDPTVTLPQVAPARAPRRRLAPSVRALALRRLRHLDLALTRIDDLRWLEVPVPFAPYESAAVALVRTCRDLDSVELPSAVDAAEQAVHDLERAVLDRLIAQVHTPGWDVGWRIRGFEQIAQRDAACPVCSSAVAREVVWAHPLRPRLELCAVVCRRCGDVNWSTGHSPGPVRLVSPPLQVVKRSAAARLKFELDVSASDTATVHAGFAFRRRKNLGMPPGAAVSFPPPRTGHTSLDAVVDLVAGDPPLDTHSILVVTLVGGRLQTFLRAVHVSGTGEA